MKVCIIGDGLISLTLAKALVNKDIYVDIFYKQNSKTFNQSRTLGISKSNIEYFNKNISNIKKILWEIKEIKIFTENSINNEITNFSDSNEQLFSIVKNHKLYDLLNVELKNNKYFSYKKNIAYNNLIKKDYKLIINCDPNHEITKKFFSKKLEKKYNSFAYTAIIKHKNIHSNFTATQIFTKDGPIAFLPISNTETSVVYSLRVKNQNKKIDIISLIKRFNSKYEIKNIKDISRVELKSENLRKYYSNNILGFGDLLHKLHPLAGQGFNMSIRDTNELIQLIDKKIKLGLDIDSSICIDFQNRTKNKNYIFSRGVDLIYEIFNLESKINSQIFSTSIRFIGNNKPFNKILRNFADTGIQN